MSDHTIKAPKEERFNLTQLGVMPMGLLVTAIVLLAVSIIWGFFDKQQFAFSWLTGFMYVFTIAAGGFFWVLIHHAMDCDWSVVVRRIMETLGTLFFPWITLLFIPVLICIPIVLKWWTTDPHVDHILGQKAPLLNHGMFYVRAIMYFTFFCIIPMVMKHLSVKQDADGDVKYSLLMRKSAYASIPWFAIFITFAGIDYIMALNHHWFSTMFGVYIFAGAVGSGMAMTILISNFLRCKGYLREVMTAEHNHIMGKLLFAFTVFWGYVAFSQYMLIYYANIPEETIYFAHRNTGSWKYISLILVFCRFFVPFIMLLTQPAKKNPIRICFAAAWILTFHFVDLYWNIMPQMQLFASHDPSHLHFAPHLLDLTCVVGMVALLAFVYLRRLPKASLFPVRDPRLYESVTLMN